MSMSTYNSNKYINQSISPILIWKLTGSLFFLFWAWNKQYKTYNCINLPSGNDNPTPVDPKTDALCKFLCTVTPTWPYKNGIIPIEPNNG